MNPASAYVPIGDERGEDGEVLRHLYAALYSTADRPTFPWGESCFDCVVCVCDPALARKQADDIALDIVGWNVDWVDTTGEDAERLHDIIDAASVRIGRQNMVGDGSPMTAWHEDAVTIPEIAKAARFCGGGQEHVLLLVVGDDSHLQAVVEQVRHGLIEQCE